MKKGLSVLLILAALFGFYGGATSLNDVLDCKEYWEEKGKQTTADLNKLEDGINQLKDNEQAYLDGKDTLAEGEKTLADGEAQYAKGLADYEAAPGKLADARKKLAAGEAKLADGQDSIDGLTKLIAGIKQIRNGYNNDWRPGYEKLKNGREKLHKGVNGAYSDLQALAAFLKEGDRPAYLAALKDVGKDDKKQTAKDYKDFIKSTNNLAKNLPKIQEEVEEKSKNATDLYNNLLKFSKGNPATADGQKLLMTFAGACAQYKDSMDTLSALPAVKTKFSSEVATLAGKYAAYAQKNAVLEQKKEAVKTAYAKVAKYDTNGDQQFSDEEKANIPADELPNLVAYGDAVADAQATGAEVQAAAGEAIEAVLANKDTILEGMKQASGYLAAVNEKVNGDKSKLKNDLLPGLQEFNKAATPEAIDKLSDGQNTIAGGVSTVAGAVLGNKTLKAGVKKNFGSKAIRLLKKYKPSKNPLHTSKANFAAFEKQMDKNPGIEAFLKKAQSLLAKTKADGLKALADGKKALADGKKQYAQGLKDYEAAPAKLADAEQKLADGRKQLADGKAKLGEYEDGEQQVRDGLATVMGSEANGGLDSILDRRNGDEDFDNGDNHLELDEGLSAVDTARGYQADSGELITEEIMARAIGTGLSLGAAALACLAALLGLLKKYKGAGIAALLAAAAGCVGIYQGVNAGSEFSSIAGSTVGNMPWIAAGVLAGVAALHAITHFTAKKDA